MKKYVFISLFVFFLFILGFVLLFKVKPELISPLPSFFSRKTDLSPYSFENLKKRDYFPSEIKMEEVLSEEELYVSYLFSFSAEGRRITGIRRS